MLFLPEKEFHNSLLISLYWYVCLVKRRTYPCVFISMRADLRCDEIILICLTAQCVKFKLWMIIYFTHWGRVTHICVGKLTIIGSDNGLSPERRQAIISTSAGILLIGPLGTNFRKILIEIQTFSLKKIRLKMSSAKCCSFRLGLNVLSAGSFYIYIQDPTLVLTVSADLPAAHS